MRLKFAIKMLDTICAFIYASALAYGEIKWMQGKSFFIQMIPMLIMLVIAMFCEET